MNLRITAIAAALLLGAGAAGADTVTVVPVGGSLTNGGEFVLQIAGLETGTSNGTYSGQLNVTPVPFRVIDEYAASGHTLAR
jgi:hypothetical protein